MQPPHKTPPGVVSRKIGVGAYVLLNYELSLWKFTIYRDYIWHTEGTIACNL